MISHALSKSAGHAVPDQKAQFCEPDLAGSRLKIMIRGAVQGVGFRPFVFRLAKELLLCGWVGNSSCGVSIEVEGKPDSLNSFLNRLKFHYQLKRPPNFCYFLLLKAFL